MSSPGQDNEGKVGETVSVAGANPVQGHKRKVGQAVIRTSPVQDFEGKVGRTASVAGANPVQDHVRKVGQALYSITKGKWDRLL